MNASSGPTKITALTDRPHFYKPVIPKVLEHRLLSVAEVLNGIILVQGLSSMSQGAKMSIG